MKRPRHRGREQIAGEAGRLLQLVGHTHEGGRLNQRDQPHAQPSATGVGILGGIHSAQSRISELHRGVEQGQIHATDNHEGDRQQRQDDEVERLMALILPDQNRDLMLAEGDQGAEAEHQRHRHRPGAAKRPHERAMVGDMGAFGAVTKEQPAQRGEQPQLR